MDGPKSDVAGEEKSEGEGDAKRIAPRKRWVAVIMAHTNWAEALGAVSTAIVVPFAVWQLFLLIEANEHARDSTERELRAYVTAVEGRVLNENGQDFVQITIKNAGQTPAHELRATCVVYLTHYGVPQPPPPKITDYDFTGDAGEMPDARITPGTDKSQGSIGDVILPASDGVASPSAVLMTGEKAFVYGSLLPEEIALPLVDANYAIHCNGTITYRDIYGRLQTSSYHFVQYRQFAKIMEVNETGNAME
jgi:hypothetical protein